MLLQIAECMVSKNRKEKMRKQASSGKPRKTQPPGIFLTIKLVCRSIR